MIEAKQMARKLIARFQTNDPFKIADSLDYITLFVPLHGIRGFHQYVQRCHIIYIDDSLDSEQQRWVCAHELGHWVLHQKLYSGTGDVAAYEGKTSSDESHGLIERQADALATALLMPIPQIKKCFYHLRPGKSKELLIAEMAQIFQVSKQAIQIRLEAHNLL